MRLQALFDKETIDTIKCKDLIDDVGSIITFPTRVRERIVFFLINRFLFVFQVNSRWITSCFL